MSNNVLRRVAVASEDRTSTSYDSICELFLTDKYVSVCEWFNTMSCVLSFDFICDAFPPHQQPIGGMRCLKLQTSSSRSLPCLANDNEAIARVGVSLVFTLLMLQQTGDSILNRSLYGWAGTNLLKLL